MAKIKPNESCPCGSGKKYKKCHSGKDMPRLHPIEVPEGFDLKKLQAVHVDPDNKLNLLFTNDILVNQLTRDTAAIEASFDSFAETDLKASSVVFSEACGIIFPQLIKRRNGTAGPQATCARLLNYAVESYVASLHLARGGYRRQYGAIVRNIIETLAVVLQIHWKPDEYLPAFNNDKLDSPKAINFAKKILPPFGPLYGHLCDFVHVGYMQNQISRLIKYDKEEDSLKYILSTMRVHSWLIYVVAEIVFYSSVTNPKYWKKVAEHKEGMEFSYDPSKETIEWLNQYFGAAMDIVGAKKEN
ncbi:MAG: YecA family protein [Alphaproteobacteria bacterium]